MAMKLMVSAIAFVVLAGPICDKATYSQTPAAAPQANNTGNTLAGEVQANYERIKPNVVKAAEKMPPTDYAFQPTPDIRTFARVVNHVTEAQFRSCGAMNHKDQNDWTKPPADTADKATILDALKASFAECDKAFASLTDANMSEMQQVGAVKRSRIGLAWGTVSHDNEQYATLALYLRLKGLVPPSSEK